MLELQNVREFFPKAREVVLPVSGAGCAWNLAMLLLQLESPSVMQMIVRTCVLGGFLIVSVECIFLKPVQIPRQIVLCVQDIMEPVVLVFCLLVAGSYLGFFQVTINAHDALMQFGRMCMANILCISLQAVVGLLVAYLMQDQF